MTGFCSSVLLTEPVLPDHTPTSASPVIVVFILFFFVLVLHFHYVWALKQEV